MYTVKINEQTFTYEKKPLIISNCNEIIIQEDLFRSRTFYCSDTITITITKTN